MAQYVQTVLVPLPRQHLSEKEWYSKNSYGRRGDNKRREEVNSIIAFFRRSLRPGPRGLINDTVIRLAMDGPEKIFALTDEPVEDDDGRLSVAGKRFRRCVGCVRCLTETPGRCVLKDGFPEISDRIMDSDVLEIRSEARKNNMSPAVLKLVERISNELQAFTELGGYEPRSVDDVRLRKIRIVMKGPMEDRGSFESETLESLRMGPVQEVEFEYV